MAQKVYNCVPINEAWSMHKIVTEMARVVGRPDAQIIHGCLRHLTDVGLVKEPSPSHYQRVAFKEEIHVPEPTPIDAAKKPAERTPFERLATLAGTLRSVADCLDEIALDIEHSNTEVSEELTKLRQLKTLLKGL